MRESDIKYKRAWEHAIKWLVDLIFPKCKVYKWGRVYRTKRVFILKYWWSKRR